MFDERPAGHPLLTAPHVAAEAARAALASSGLSLTLGQVRSAIAELHSARATMEALHLHLLRIAQEHAVSAPAAAGSTAHFLTHTLHSTRGQARADLAAAEATDPDRGVLRGFGGALGDGEVQRDHVDVAVRALSQLPTGLVRERRADLDALVTDHARSFSPADSATLARHLVAVLAPDGLEAFADEALDRRSWSVSTRRSGMVCAQGQLEPTGGAIYTAVLNHLTSAARHLPAPDDGAAGDDGEIGQPPPDTLDRRTLAQRRADAQVEMARLAAAALKLENPTAEPVRVVVHCTPEQLADPGATPDAEEDDAAVAPTTDDRVDDSVAATGADTGTGPGADTGTGPSNGNAPAPAPAPGSPRLPPGLATDELTGPIPARALHRHACDAIIDRVLLDRAGAIVGMDSLGRLATRSQRRALAARDGGCAWPGCSAPAPWTEAHHVIWWSRGGPTTLDNLVLLCPRHHTEIHAEWWSIQMLAGVPWFIPPATLDPDRTPRRNSLHDAIARIRRAAQRLAQGQQLTADDLLPLSPPPPRSPAPPLPPAGSRAGGAAAAPPRPQRDATDTSLDPPAEGRAA